METLTKLDSELSILFNSSNWEPVLEKEAIKGNLTADLMESECILVLSRKSESKAFISIPVPSMMYDRVSYIVANLEYKLTGFLISFEIGLNPTLLPQDILVHDIRLGKYQEIVRFLNNKYSIYYSSVRQVSQSIPIVNPGGGDDGTYVEIVRAVIEIGLSAIFSYCLTTGVKAWKNNRKLRKHIKRKVQERLLQYKFGRDARNGFLEALNELSPNKKKKVSKWIGDRLVSKAMEEIEKAELEQKYRKLGVDEAIDNLF